MERRHFMSRRSDNVKHLAKHLQQKQQTAPLAVRGWIWNLETLENRRLLSIAAYAPGVTGSAPNITVLDTVVAQMVAQLTNSSSGVAGDATVPTAPAAAPTFTAGIAADNLADSVAALGVTPSPLPVAPPP